MSTKYLLDTSVFIQAQQTYYAFEIAPIFWEHLVNQGRMGIIRSIDKVKDEIHYFNESLTKWANNDFKRWESTTGRDTREKHRELMEWATASRHYNQRAKDMFADTTKADAWLIAHAWANQYTVVTQESRDDNKKREIPIPNACLKFGVPYINTFQMMHELGLSLSQIDPVQKEITSYDG